MISNDDDDDDVIGQVGARSRERPPVVGPRWGQNEHVISVVRCSVLLVAVGDGFGELSRSGALHPVQHACVWSVDGLPFTVIVPVCVRARVRE